MCTPSAFTAKFAGNPMACFLVFLRTCTKFFFKKLNFFWMLWSIKSHIFFGLGYLGCLESAKLEKVPSQGIYIQICREFNAFFPCISAHRQNFFSEISNFFLGCCANQVQIFFG